MCGNGSRRICLGLLLFLLLLPVSLSADALSELQAILQSYERTTISLSTKYDSLNLSLESLQNSIEKMRPSLSVLESNYEKQSSLLSSQDARLKEVEKISTDSGKQIKDLQTGYLRMERKFRIYRTVGVVSIATLAGMIIMFLII